VLWRSSIAALYEWGDRFLTENPPSMRDADFEQLFSAHASDLLGFLVYRTGDQPLAEDLLADTFERALRARRRFDPRRGSEKNWLYAVALNLLRDHLRRAAVEKRALEGEGLETAQSDPIGSVATRDTLKGALATLSEEEREAIALRFGADLTVPEIARVTGQRLTTVEGRVYRALRRLRTELERTEGGGP